MGKSEFFVLYRNYHLEYDNPYQRSFSNYQRYKGSILEDYFYLDSEAFGQLYSNAYQPQAENGLYFRTRYQFARSWLATVEYDRFTRKTDDAKYYRWVATLQYSPVSRFALTSAIKTRPVSVTMMLRQISFFAATSSGSALLCACPDTISWE